MLVAQFNGRLIQANEISLKERINMKKDVMFVPDVKNRLCSSMVIQESLTSVIFQSASAHLTKMKVRSI